LRLGLINQADGRRLLLEITTHLIIPEQAPTNCGRQPCGYDHNFAVGLLDVLDVMCGTGKSHPDDVA
jgi:hypothetical protein